MALDQELKELQAYSVYVEEQLEMAHQANQHLRRQLRKQCKISDNHGAKENTPLSQTEVGETSYERPNK